MAEDWPFWRLDRQTEEPRGPAGDAGVMASPIIVYGALRSGTTVFRLMLDAHPGINAVGEADYLVDFLRETPEGLRYDSDGLAMNRIFQHAGLAIPDPADDGRAAFSALLGQLAAKGAGRLAISAHHRLDLLLRLLPDARVIHLMRDPRDVARSCVGMGWASTPYFGVSGWIETETDWNAAGQVPSDRTHELYYEDLIADMETELRAVCRFLDLPFSDAMLSYAGSTTYDEPDMALVRQWRGRYAPRDLALVEGRLGGLLAERGYEPSGTPPVTPGAARRRLMRARDKAGVLKARIRKFGAPLVAAEILSRPFGLTRWRRRVLQRMNEISASLLK